MSRKLNRDQLSLADQIKIEIPHSTPPEFIPYLRYALSIVWGLR